VLFADRKLVEALQYWDVAASLDILRKRPGLAKKRLSDRAAGRTMWAISWAAYSGLGEVADLMLELGASVEQTEEPLHWRPLHFAANLGHAAVVTVLIDRGAERDPVDDEGRTPFHLAVLDGHVEVARVLAESGCEIDRELPEGGTLLHSQAAEGHGAVVELLLAAGSDPNPSDAHGSTPLHRAARADRVEAVRILLDYGANVNARDAKGHTPLDLARVAPHAASAQLLALRGGTSGT